MTVIHTVFYPQNSSVITITTGHKNKETIYREMSWGNTAFALLLGLVQIELLYLIVHLLVEDIFPETHFRPNPVTLYVMRHVSKVTHPAKLLQ